MAAKGFDVVVVGAGVVGCAIVRRCTLEGAHVAVVEKASVILDGASKANSAIFHTGFDASHDSLKLWCIREGYREYVEIHHELGLPLDGSGAYVVAWTDGERERLDDILAQVDVVDDKVAVLESLPLEDGITAIAVPAQPYRPCR